MKLVVFSRWRVTGPVVRSSIAANVAAVRFLVERAAAATFPRRSRDSSCARRTRAVNIMPPSLLVALHSRVLVPKSLTTLKTYNRTQFAADVVAGVIVGIVALPLAIAFAIASGVTPDRGLYTAIVAGFLISALGGSRVQIGGPTGAFIVIVYGIVQQYGVDGLLVATMMAGVLLIALGVAKLGGAIKF